MKRTLLSMVVGFSISAQAFADNLYDVYQLALENDPVVNQAKADRDSAFAGISLSRANLLPQISGSISYTDSSSESPQSFLDENDNLRFNVISSDSTSFDMDLSLSMSIYDHSNWIGLDRAEKVAQRSDTNLAITQQQLIVRVTQAYLEVLRAKDSLEFVQANKKAVERQLEQTKQRFEVGLTAITDVHEAQASFDNTVADEIRAGNQVEASLEALREITGRYHGDLNILNTESFSATQPLPAKVSDWLEIAENQSLDLTLQKFSVDIAKEDIDAATAGYYPSLGLSANLGRSDSETTVFGNTTDFPSTDSNSVTLSLSIPIYQGGSVRAQTKQARFNYVSASEQLEQTHRSTVRSVRSSYNDVTAAISTIRALEQAVVSAESALRATEAGFEVGTRTIVDVLQSTSNLFQSRSNLSSARYDFIEAVVALKRAAGNLNEKDLVEISRGLMAAG